MANTKEKKGGFMAAKGQSPNPSEDASTKIKGGHVNDGATRKETASNQAPLGDRVA